MGNRRKEALRVEFDGRIKLKLPEQRSRVTRASETASADMIVAIMTICRPW